MKNRTVFLTLLFILFCKISFADQYEFFTSNLNASYSKNIIKAFNGTAISKNKNLKIEGSTFEYNKNLEFLKVTKGKLFVKMNNFEVSFNSLEVDGKKLNLIAKGNVKIIDKENNIIFHSETIKLGRLNNILSSSTNSKIIDSNNNLFQLKKFVYKIKKNVLKIKNGYLEDQNNNKLIFDSAFINTKTNKLVGKNAEINLNNISFNKDNEPRMKGAKVIEKNKNTEITKGVFTACKNR